MSLFNTSYIFEAISKLGDQTYYTYESFDKCKKEITNYALIEAQYAGFYSSVLNEVNQCNKPNAAIQVKALDLGLTSALQADACDMEPVNAFGY